MSIVLSSFRAIYETTQGSAVPKFSLQREKLGNKKDNKNKEIKNNSFKVILRHAENVIKCYIFENRKITRNRKNIK